MSDDGDCCFPVTGYTKPAMTDHAQRARAVRALTCLYLQLPTSIADDVFKIVTEAFEEDERRLTQAHAQGRREGLEEAAKVADNLASKWWAEYKHGEHRADPHWQGMSDGAEQIAQAVRAIAKEAGHE